MSYPDIRTPLHFQSTYMLAVYMYVCMYVCMYVSCMYVCMCVCMYVSCIYVCMYAVILTFILLTGHEHIALINFLTICLQTTTNPPPFHPQLQQENKLNTNYAKSTQTSRYVSQHAQTHNKGQLLQKKK
jgi:hypothetical protein